MPREESADLPEWAARSASSVKEATNKTERTNIYHLDGLAAGLLCTEKRNYATGAAEPVDCTSEGGKKRSLGSVLHPWMESGFIRLGVWFWVPSLICRE